MRVLHLLLALLAAACRANVALTDAWSPLPLGQCTAAPIPSESRTMPPYQGANADPLIGEGVTSGSQGRTCSFEDKNAKYLPPAWRAKYLLAASQDVYAGMHLPVCDTCKNKNDLWVAKCLVNQTSKADAESGKSMCSASCGECYIINGAMGSQLFIVNEIADVNAVGQNGMGLNFHLDNDHSSEVRTWGGVSKDIQWKRVPCPTFGPMYILVSGNWGPNAIFFTVLNHAVGVRAILTRGGDGGSQEWVPLVRDWTNRWHWESYGCTSCPAFQNGYGAIHRGSTKQDFVLRIVSVDGQQVDCVGLTAKSGGSVMKCVTLSGSDGQFSADAALASNRCTSCNGSSVDLCLHPPKPPKAGLSSGDKAALVIFLLILPVGAGCCVGGWVVWRKTNNQPIVPPKVAEVASKAKASTKALFQKAKVLSPK